MIMNLQVRDFAIVDRIDIEFEPGMTVLTGETGAGKSILVDALGLVLGERGNAQLVRDGAKRAEFAGAGHLHRSQRVEPALRVGRGVRRLIIARGGGMAGRAGARS